MKRVSIDVFDGYGQKSGLDGWSFISWIIKRVYSAFPGMGMFLTGGRWIDSLLFKAIFFVFSKTARVGRLTQLVHA